MARKYKDSGIEWIGQIPKEWKICRIKNVAALFGRIGFRGYTSDDLNKDGDGAITLSPSNMIPMGMDFSKVTYLSWKKYEESPEIMIRNGDLLMVKTGSSYGKVSYVDNLPKEATINPQILRVVPSINHKYLGYYMQTDLFIYQVEGGIVGGTIPTISQEKINNFHVVLPPLSDQQRIADYLDKVCGKADEMIALQEKMIEELKAYKQSIITEAVTKGLNPNVPMKDSGIDWIGEIPEHWDKDKIIRIFNLIGSGTTPSSSDNELYEGNLNWIQSGDINGGDLYESKNKISEKTLKKYSALTMYDAPFIIIAMYGASVGNISISHINGCVNQACCVMSETKQDFKYVFYAIKSAKDYLIYKAVGGGQPNISQSTLKQLWLPVPSLFEQQQIASFLDSKCSEIDSLIAIKQQKITELKEYKKSVIYEYVTGKKEVV